MIQKSTLRLTLGILALPVYGFGTPFAGGKSGDCGFSCENVGKGVLLAATMLDMERGSVPGSGGALAYKYGSAPFCTGRIPEAPETTECTLMNTYCNDKEGNGPAIWVYRQVVPPGGADWKRLGWTCYPDLMPGRVDWDMIAAAFHRTDFAKPTVAIQPVNARTLVRLPTYFEADFPEAGYEPNEVDDLNPAAWFGMHISVKPVLNTATFHLGDGRVIGPTTSLGGPYPSGDVNTTYERSGTYGVRADVVYKGFVTIDGSDWLEIPGQVDLQGETIDLAVLTAKNELYLPGN